MTRLGLNDIKTIEDARLDNNLKAIDDTLRTIRIGAANDDVNEETGKSLHYEIIKCFLNEVKRDL